MERVYGPDLDTPFIVVTGIHTDIEPNGFAIPQVTECPAYYEPFEMEIFTQGSNSADNLQTVLPIDLPIEPSNVYFVNVRTGDAGADDQPYEQFKIVAVGQNGTALASTDYTTDIDNTTLEDEVSNLGMLVGLSSENTKNLLLVHKADPVYGNDISSENSVAFKSLCYKVDTP